MEFWSFYTGIVASSAAWVWLWLREKRHAEHWQGRHRCLSRLMEQHAEIKRRHATCATRRPDKIDITALDDAETWMLSDCWAELYARDDSEWRQQ